jgi:hypothetical protein
MIDERVASTFTVTVYTRHASDCPKKNVPQWKRCNCRKYLYVYENGKDTTRSAKTRSWERAEFLAQAERNARDPVKRKLKEIEDQSFESDTGSLIYPVAIRVATS